MVLGYLLPQARRDMRTDLRGPKGTFGPGGYLIRNLLTRIMLEIGERFQDLIPAHQGSSLIGTRDGSGLIRTQMCVAGRVIKWGTGGWIVEIIFISPWDRAYLPS